MAGVEERVLDLVHRNSVLAVVAGVRQVPATERDTVAVVVRRVVTRREHLAGNACLVDVGGGHHTVDLDLVEDPAFLEEHVGSGHASRSDAGNSRWSERWPA